MGSEYPHHTTNASLGRAHDPYGPGPSTYDPYGQPSVPHDLAYPGSNGSYPEPYHDPRSSYNPYPPMVPEHGAYLPPNSASPVSAQSSRRGSLPEIYPPSDGLTHIPPMTTLHDPLQPAPYLPQSFGGTLPPPNSFPYSMHPPPHPYDWRSSPRREPPANHHPSLRSTIDRGPEDEIYGDGSYSTMPSDPDRLSRSSSPIVGPRGTRYRDRQQVRPKRDKRARGVLPSERDGHALSEIKIDPDLGEDEGEEDKIDHRKKKRNRTIRSCVPCHNHKRKCDRKRPCGRCTALGLTGTCVYEVDETRSLNDPSVAESDRLRNRIAELEQVVRELRQRQPHRPVPVVTSLASSSSTATTTPTSLHPNLADLAGNQEKASESSKRRVIVDRFARFKIDEANMQAVASAAAASKAQPNETGTTPSHSRQNSRDETPVMAKADGVEKKDYKGEPYMPYLLPGEEMVYDKTGRKTFAGALAGKSMLRRLRELASLAQSPVANDSELLTVPEDAAFTAVFPDLRKTFPFTTIWSQENFSGEIIGLLPSKDQSESLLYSWTEEINSFFLAWHTPTLVAEYRRFFSMSTAEKMNVPLANFSLFLMMCSLGCVMRATRMEMYGTPDGETVNGKEQRPPRDPRDLTSSRLQSELYLSGAYQALRLCSFMSNPTITTIQSQIMINLYLIISERAADSWTQTGSLVRQCIAMGLHVDPASLDPKMSLREAEVKRRIWWTVAGLDSLLCVSFGRPSAINFYKTNLPQDRPDDNLSDSPGTAHQVLPPSNVLSNETTDMTYHAAVFQLVIPAYELLDRIFHVDRTYSRSAIYGWFSPTPDKADRWVARGHMDNPNTYEDALRLAEDICQWYAHIPRDMRLVPDEDTKESLSRGVHAARRLNQKLTLCAKTFMIVMVLHRPYLRADPAAYPESSEICFRAAHQLLTAYRLGADAKASVLWVWWTMSFRAFHAGAVCAFLAIRQPGTELARRCVADLRGAIDVLEDRMATWKSAHPVQADLCNGLVNLERLATAATRQKTSPMGDNSRDPNLLSINWSPNAPPPGSGMTPDQSTPIPNPPLSEIRGFPEMTVTSPSGFLPNQAFSNHSGSSGETARQPSPMMMPASFQTPDGFSFPSDGFGTAETLGLPQFWASVFGIKMDGDAPGQQGPAPGSSTSQGQPF